MTRERENFREFGQWGGRKLSARGENLLEAELHEIDDVSCTSDEEELHHGVVQRNEGSRE